MPYGSPACEQCVSKRASHSPILDALLAFSFRRRGVPLRPVDHEFVAHFPVEEHFLSVERNRGSLDEPGESGQNARFAEGIVY